MVKICTGLNTFRYCLDDIKLILGLLKNSGGRIRVTTCLDDAGVKVAKVLDDILPIMGIRTRTSMEQVRAILDQMKLDDTDDLIQQAMLKLNFKWVDYRWEKNGHYIHITITSTIQSVKYLNTYSVCLTGRVQQVLYSSCRQAQFQLAIGIYFSS